MSYSTAIKTNINFNVTLSVFQRQIVRRWQGKASIQSVFVCNISPSLDIRCFHKHKLYLIIALSIILMMLMRGDWEGRTERQTQANVQQKLVVMLASIVVWCRCSLYWRMNIKLLMLDKSFCGEHVLHLNKITKCTSSYWRQWCTNQFQM